MLIDIDKIKYVAKYTNRVENLLKMFPYLYKLYLTSSTMNNVVLDDMLRYDTGIFLIP